MRSSVVHLTDQQPRGSPPEPGPRSAPGSPPGSVVRAVLATVTLPDGPTLVSASWDTIGTPVAAVARADGSVTLIDLMSRTIVDTLMVVYPATALAWTPNGDLIIACRRHLLRVRR